MKSQRNYSRPEPRRVGNVIIIVSMLVSLCILSLIKAHFAPTGQSDETPNFGPEKEDETGETDSTVTEEDGGGEGEEEEGKSNPIELSKPTCFETSRRSDTCEAQGEIRVQGISQTIFVDPMDQEWKIKPYCRKHDPFALGHVKEWTLKPLSREQSPPQCTKNHSVPAMVFSNGGFTGNLFHDYTDVLVPVFISSYHFHGEVQFLVSSLKSWWVNKFILIFKQLSKYEIIDIDNDQEIRCFPRAVVGPTFHKELGVDAAKTPTGYGAADFKKLLRDAFGLERATAEPTGDNWDIRRKPRLLIISRKNTRTFLNERAMVDMATSLGFDVRIGEPDMNTDVAKFARLVNSADVMIGVHGAGLTNMVFLPAGAVLIQVVPYGGLEWLARGTFKDPSKDMEINYLEYMIQLDETTLSEQYPKDHPVLKDPDSIHKQGWDALKTVYLDRQNVRPHLGRLKNTLMEALRLLPHTH
ncbi:alpha-1,3-arabinosyltransferase XAT3-like [Typha latifolia]|uniref:alpha-1,3-arabinosyltransferase XAT3-like n=1 Tax=Typha latifolia TaxID=4733 RepID=UPI003C2B1653